MRFGINPIWIIIAIFIIGAAVIAGSWYLDGYFELKACISQCEVNNPEMGPAELDRHCENICTNNTDFN